MGLVFTNDLCIGCNKCMGCLYGTAVEESKAATDDANFCEELDGAMAEIGKLIEELSSNNEEVVSIASQTNLLAQYCGDCKQCARSA